MAEPALAGFDIRRNLLMAGVVLVVVISVVFFMFRGCVPTVRGTGGYTVIYSNMSLKDAANVIARLKELTIPYDIRDDGRSVAVPKEKADQARLGLAEQNLPAGGVVGWEIFDESRLGATDFDRRIQLIRAISGELSRTIRGIQAVDDARVQIVIPETRLFAEYVAPVTASVMLRLKPGAELSAGKIKGIIHLVASSVENLQTENVTVVDNYGRILTAELSLRDRAELSAPALAPEKNIPEIVEIVTTTTLAPAQPVLLVTPEAAARTLSPEDRVLLLVQAKREMEKDLAGKAQEILNRFYPPNSAIVKVNIDYDDARGKWDLGQESKLNIKKMDGIILVDNRVGVSKELKQSTFKAVAAAIGYNRKRGDRILLQKVPFHLATPPPEIVRGRVEDVFPVKEEEKSPRSLFGWLRTIVLLLGVTGALILIVFVLRVVKRQTKEESQVFTRERQVEAPRTERAEAIRREDMTAVEGLRAAAERNPERIAEMLKNWLSE